MTQTDLQPRSHALAGCQPPQTAGRLGSWELVELVAEGAFSRIYRARPAGSAPEQPPAYAVKTLRPKWHDDTRAIGLLLREAAVGRSISHPHLISILAAQVHRPPRFVVMPWLEGTSLRALSAGSGLAAVAWPQWLGRSGLAVPAEGGREGPRGAEGRHLDLPVALGIARQVAEALEALHAAGWMHGDVKPSNVLVSPGGHVTLIDLGFARQWLGRGGRGGGEETGSAVDRWLPGPCVMGTGNYLAPELITSALRADICSDIYSLGVVLFELLSGRLPFSGKDLAELAEQHRQAKPPDLRRLAPDLPIEVVRLVREMLAKDPLRRPQTPRELIDRLVPLEIATFSERALA